jgi:hypothetical protein
MGQKPETQVSSLARATRPWDGNRIDSHSMQTGANRGTRQKGGGGRESARVCVVRPTNQPGLSTGTRLHAPLIQGAQSQRRHKGIGGRLQGGGKRLVAPVELLVRTKRVPACPEGKRPARTISATVAHSRECRRRSVPAVQQAPVARPIANILRCGMHARLRSKARKPGYTRARPPLKLGQALSHAPRAWHPGDGCGRLPAAVCCG